jgi:outer membrane immunogenic protein
MRILLLSSTFFLAIADCSFAADAVVYDQQPTAAYNWSGVYIGADAGYGWGNSTQDFDGIDYNVPLDPKGWFGGLYAGYNHQLSNGLVLGVEGDFNISGIDADGVRGIGDGVVDPSLSYGSDLKWSGSLRGRLGYAAGQFMPFVTGGLAVARYEISETVPTSYSVSKTYTGWTLGAGIDYAMTDNILLRAEYRYADYGSERFENIPSWINQSVDLSTNDIRIGMAYKF